MPKCAGQERLNEAILEEIAKVVGARNAAEVGRLLENLEPPHQQLSDHEL